MIADLAPLSAVNVGIPIDTTRLLGDTTLLVLVDRIDKVLETDEDNNRDSVRVVFKAGPLLGDANNDGRVTGQDLIIVQQNYGNTRSAVNSPAISSDTVSESAAPPPRAVFVPHIRQQDGRSFHRRPLRDRLNDTDPVDVLALLSTTN